MIFKDRVPDAYKGQNRRFYRLVDADGNEVLPEVALELLNPVQPGNEGTPLNAANLNALGTLSFTVYDVPGTYDFVAPRTGPYIVEVVGGGGLYASTSWSPFQIGGGGGGYAKKAIWLEAGEQVPVTVGAAALNGLNPNYSLTWDAAGAASSFGAYVTAPGGSGRTGGVPTTGDLNIPGSNGGVDPEYTQGISFYAVSGRLSSGYGVGSGGLTTAQGAPNGSTGGLVMISW